MTAQGITIVVYLIYELLCILFPFFSQILNSRIIRIRDFVRTVTAIGFDSVCMRRMEKYSRTRSETARFGSLQSHLDDSKISNVLSNSGGALPSCSRGKTMREFEAELADLKQENFELKMQLYVLEEQKEALEDERDAVELRINYQKLMKEYEKARSDIMEKDDLILKAGEAMSLMSKKHEEDLCILQSRASEEIEAYKQTISKLEQEILELKEKSFFMPKPAVFDDSSAMYAMAFNIGGNIANNRETHSQDKVTDLEEKVMELQDELRLKSLEIEKLREKSTSLEVEAERLRKVEAELKKKLQSMDKLNSSNISSNETKMSHFEKENKIQQSKPDGEGKYRNIVFRSSKKENDSRRNDLEVELETTKAELEELKKERTKMLTGMQALVVQNNKLSRDIERLKNRGGEKGNLSSEERGEYEGISLANKFDEKSKSDSEMPEMDDPEKSYLYSALEDKRQQVEQLNEKLRKRTIDLQELVNKELWSKNKEIEKLNRVCEKQVRDWSEQRMKLKGQEAEIKALREEVERLRHELNTRINMNSATQNVNERDVSEKQQDNHINQQLKKLKEELEKQIAHNAEVNARCEALKISVETSEKSRKDLLNSCCLLTTRLEEISAFLESLLPSLAGRKRRLAKEAIDKSREMSKSFSLSCLEESSILCKSIEPILPDVSQVDFNSEEDLDDTLLHSNVMSLEEKNNEVIQLRSQMDSLVQKLKESSPELKRKSIRQQVSPWSLSGSLQEERSFSPQPFDESSLFRDCIPGIALEDITEGTGIESFDTDTEPKNLPEVKKVGPLACGHGSESEGWSEPDRTVSLARIGLKENIGDAGSDSSESIAKSNNSSGKKRRDNEIKTLNMKIKRLEMIIESLLSEKNGNLPANINNNVSVECQAVEDGSLTHNLMAEIKEQREKLMLSLSHNDFIRQRLEEVLSSAPSSPTKADGDKSRSYDQNLLQQVIKMTDKLEESCSLCLDLETKYMESEKEKLSLIEMLNASEERANALSAELTTLKCSLKEKENELLEKQCALLELKNSVIILESRVKLSQEEAQKQTRLLETLNHENEQKSKELSQKWEKERAELICRYDEEISRLKIKAKELEADFHNAKFELGKVKEEKQIMEGEYKILFDRLEREKRDILDKESQRRIEAEERLNEAVRIQAELRIRLDSEANKIAEMETGQKLSERAWRRRVAALESTGAETEARLRRKLDQLTLSNSEAVLERTRLANERLVLQRDHAVKCELERRVTELELANHELEARLASLSKPDTVPTSPIDFKRQRSNPSSDYTSDHEHHNWFPACVRTNNSSSPDLGIESDNRMSSLEALSSPKPNGEDKPDKLELENVELRAQLARTRQALEETIAQLTSANQRKRQVEKAICKQLHKTHDILKQARLNLDGKDKPVI